VPYYNDTAPTYGRVHSPESIKRLLQAAGWKITAYLERGEDYVAWLAGSPC